MKIPYFNTDLKSNWWNRNGQFNDELYKKVQFVKSVKNFNEIEPSEEGTYELFINNILMNNKNPEKAIAKFIIQEKRFVARTWFVITSIITIALLTIIYLK